MSAPALRVDTTSAEPPYEQIRRQLSELIGSGELAPGDRLPTVRQLAADLALAVNTVARAYRELEQAGWVVTRRRAGTHVAEPPPRSGTGATGTSGLTGQHAPGLDDAAAAYVRRARQLAAPEEDIVHAVRRALGSVDSPP